MILEPAAGVAAPFARDPAGVELAASEDFGRVAVLALDPAGAGARAGLRDGDTIISLGGEAPSSLDAAAAALTRPGRLAVTVACGGHRLDLTLELAADRAAGQAMPSAAR